MVAKSMLPTFMRIFYKSYSFQRSLRSRIISWLCFACWGGGLWELESLFYEVLIWLMTEGEALTVLPLKRVEGAGAALPGIVGSKPLMWPAARCLQRGAGFH